MIPLKSLPSPQKAAIIKHVLTSGIQTPVISFSWITRLSRYFYEAVIKREVMTYGVLPGRESLLIIREPVHYKLADL